MKKKRIVNITEKVDGVVIYMTKKLPSLPVDHQSG